jgi:hypothetical protein
MTRQEVAAWLRVREPAPPRPLAARLDLVLASCPGEALAGAATMPAALGAVGLYALRSLDGRAGAEPDVGMDLLAADAFVTYAFEAAAEAGAGLEELAASLLLGTSA